MEVRSRIPGQTAILPSGTILQFNHHGKLNTTELPKSKQEEAENFLAPLVDVPGTGFFSDQPLAAPGEAAAQSDVTHAAQVALDKVAAAQRAAVGG